MITVEFHEVGRGRKSWRSTVPSVCHTSLMRQIKKHQALMSRDVEFELDDSTGKGEILAGARTVGRFTIVKD